MLRHSLPSGALLFFRLLVGDDCFLLAVLKASNLHVVELLPAVIRNRPTVSIKLTQRSANMEASSSGNYERFIKGLSLCVSPTFSVSVSPSRVRACARTCAYMRVCV